MRTICVYCKAVIKEGKSKPISHGCCRKCFRVKGKEFGMSESQIDKALAEMKG